MSASFRQRISRLHQRSLLALLTRMFVLLVAAAGMPITAMAWFDSMLVLSRAWRWFAFISAVVAAPLVLVGGVRRCRRADRRSITVAMDARSELPSGYVISTSAQFADKVASDPAEENLLRRLHAEAERLAITARPVHPWPGRHLVGAAFVLVVSAATLLRLDGTQPFHRMVVPWRPVPYTQVTLLPSGRAPARHEAFDLRGLVQGRLPDHALVLFDTGQRFEVPVEADGTFALSFGDGIAEPAIATAQAGADGRSLPLTIALRPTPARTGYAHRITPPAYTGQDQRTETRPSFALLRGSELRFFVSFDLPATGVRMVFDTDRPPIDLRADADDPLAWHADLQRITRTFGYHLEVSDTEGVYPVEDQPQQVVVTPDRPPFVKIIGDNAGQLKSPADILAVEYVARDDIGLASVDVRYYRVGDSEPRTKPVASLPPMTLHHEGQWRLALGDLAVRPLDMVVVILEARNRNDVDGPGIAMSEPLIVEIPDFGEAEDGESSDEDGGGGDASVQEINPLVMQRQVYRDTLRVSMRLGATPAAELAGRQVEILQHLVAMRDSEMAQALGPEFVDLIVTAATEAQGSARALAPRRSIRAGSPHVSHDFNESLNHQGRAMQALLEAARIQMAFQPETADDGPEGDEGGDESDEVINYTLISRQTASSDDGDDDEQEQELIARALLALQEALEQQQLLNQDVDESAQAAGQGGDSSSDQDPSETPEEHAGLAGRQFALQEVSQQIAQQIEQLRQAETGADPQLAAEQMRRAAEFQREAAEAILAGGIGEASAKGIRSEDAMHRAIALAESLLDRGVQSRIEAQFHAPGYQNLIRNYSRKLSYDQ